MPSGILGKDTWAVNSVTICTDKTNHENLSINDLLENIYILLRYIISKNKGRRNMKKDWETKTLGEVCEIEYGTRVVNKRDSGSVYPVYGGGGATFKMDIFNREDRIVVARFAISPQCVRFVSGKFFLNDSGLTVSPINKNQLSMNFLNWQLYFLNNEIYLLARGSAQKNLDVSAFRELKIVVPPLSEQKRIVKILDEKFEVIEKLKKITEQQLKDAKELFESRLDEVFLSNRCDSKSNVGDIAKIEYGYTTSATKNGEYRFIRITDINPDGTLSEHNAVHVVANKDNSRFELHIGDLLMARTGATYGKVLFFESMEKSIFASYLIRVTFSNPELHKLYWYFAKSRIYWKQANILSAGAAQPQFNGGALKQIIFSYPSNKIYLMKIIKELDELSEKTKELEAIFRRKIADLEELKKSYLHEAFSGNL